MIDTRLAPYGALILRLSLGIMFIAHALLKVFVFTLPGTVGFFQSIGYPASLAYVTVAAELIGGALLIIGIAPRLVAGALVPILIGATLVHVPNGWLFSAPNGGWEYPAFLVAAGIVQFLIGDGAATLVRSDRLVPALSAARAAANR